jgi:phosphoadenosine phosphosulfate reductase
MSYKTLLSRWREEETLSALRFFSREFEGRHSLAFSHQAEDVVLLDLLKKAGVTPRVFTISTGKLFPESEAMNRETEEFFGIRLDVIRPEPAEVERMTEEHGEDLFYKSTELRKLCCRVRKVVPLNAYLKGFSLWFTGLRKEQSPTRTDLDVLEYDEASGIYKVSPLLEWTTGQVMEYAEKHRLPHNQLYAKGFLSIGCEPCTRPASDPADIRSGRWWWESPEHKECGLHLKK